MDYLLAQVDNPEGKNVVVSGSGGTGKTTIICELICTLLASGHRVAVTAMTGKATAVLRGKVRAAIWEKHLVFPKENLLIETVTKITKKSKVMDVTTSGETKYSSVWRHPSAFNYDVLFVDELSMVPHYISKWWQETDCRVFGFGDECQLPEVVTSEVKNDLAGFEHDLHINTGKFVSGYGIKALKQLAECQLHKVLRSDNEIALLCHDLRDFSQSKQEIVSVIKRYAATTDCIEYSTDIKDLKTDGDWQILAYTNKMCQEINDQLCIGGDRYPDMGDKVLLFDNLNPLGLYNGDTVYFGEFQDKIVEYNNRQLKNKGRPIRVCVKWRGAMPKPNGNRYERMYYQEVLRYYEDKKAVDLQRVLQIPELISSCGFTSHQMKVFTDMFNEICAATTDNGERISRFLEYLETTDLDMAQWVSQGMVPSPMLYFVKLDYGYAVTTHKSQGSEYNNVCYLMERFDKPLIYTGLSRAKQKLMVINLTKTR